MSAARRRKPSVRPNPKVESPIDDLPELEPVDAEAEEFDVLEPVDDELPELEPIEDESPVKVAQAPAEEDGFDVRVDVTVPEMSKSEVLDAVRGPLVRLASVGDALRFRRVVVAFGGDAMIGSAVKALVAETLSPCRPLTLVVRRGFGDEVVHEGELPQASLTAESADGRTKIVIDDSNCAPKDVPFAVESALAEAAAKAVGQHVEVTLASGAAPHRTVVDALEAAFSTATSLRIDGAVRFDRELEARVVAEQADDAVTIRVDAAEDEATTASAFDLALPKLSGMIAGKRVTLTARDRAMSDAQVTHLVDWAVANGAAEVVLARRDEEDDVIVPAMIRAAASEDGARTGLQVRPGSRGPSAVITAFRRELAGLTDQVQGKDVTVDWPGDDFTLDASVEAACLGDILKSAGPRSIACSFGGADREPFWPAPVQIDDAASPVRIGIDTEAGKPVEVLRAVERHVAPWAAENARGKDVRVEFRGQGNVSRTMAGRVREIFEHASAGRLETSQDGVADVILPPLLTATTSGEEVALDLETGGRSPEQVELALGREVEAADWPADGAFRIQEPGDLADRLASVLADRGASRVVVGSSAPVQVHPSLFGPLGVDGRQLTLHACPGSDESVVAAQIDREIPLLLADVEELASHDVVLAWPDGRKEHPLTKAALAAIQAAGPQRVLLAGKGRARQIHPEVVLDYVSVLGRRDADEAPMILLGIDVCPEDEDADAHRAKVIEKLGLLDLDGRRVLLIGRDEGQDLAIDPADGGLFGAVCAAAAQRAAAVLVFRGADRHGRPHFVVQDSKLEALPTGTRVGDPRPSARA